MAFRAFESTARSRLEAFDRAISGRVGDDAAVQVPEGYPKAFPFRGMHFFASIEKAKRHVPTWKPKYNMRRAKGIPKAILNTRKVLRKHANCIQLLEFWWV